MKDNYYKIMPSQTIDHWYLMYTNLILIRRSFIIYHKSFKNNAPNTERKISIDKL